MYSQINSDLKSALDIVVGRNNYSLTYYGDLHIRRHVRGQPDDWIAAGNIHKPDTIRWVYGIMRDIYGVELEGD